MPRLHNKHITFHLHPVVRDQRDVDMTFGCAARVRPATVALAVIRSRLPNLGTWLAIPPYSRAKNMDKIPKVLSGRKKRAKKYKDKKRRQSLKQRLTCQRDLLENELGRVHDERNALKIQVDGLNR